MSGWLSGNEVLIQSALVYGLLAYSVQVALRSGLFSFAGAGFYGIGGYGSAVLVLKHGWSPELAILASLAASAVVAIGLSLILTRLRALYLGMATVAFNLLVQVLVTQWEVTGGALGLFGIPVGVTTLGLVITVVGVSALLWRRERGAGRRTLEALRLDEQLAPVVGINVLRRRHEAFVLSSMLGALSGAMNTLLFGTIFPTQIGFSLLVTVLMIVVIGGSSSWIGALVGAFIVTWLPDWLAFTGDLRPIIQGLIVVVLAVAISDGLIGFVARGWRWARVRRLRARPPAAAVEAPS